MAKIMEAKKFLELAAGGENLLRNSWGYITGIRDRNASISNDFYRVHVAFDLPEAETHEYQPMKLIGYKTIRTFSGETGRVPEYEKDGPVCKVTDMLQFKNSCSLEDDMVGYGAKLAKQFTEAILDLPAAIQFVVDAGQFKRAIKSAMVIARDTADAVSLTFFDELQALNIVGYNRDTGTTSTLIAANIQPHEIKQTAWGFNGKYLLDALQGFDENENLPMSITTNGAILIGDLKWGKRFVAIMGMHPTGNQSAVKGYNDITDAQKAEVLKRPMGWRKDKWKPFKKPAPKVVEPPFVEADGLEAWVWKETITSGRRKETVVWIQLERKIK